LPDKISMDNMVDRAVRNRSMFWGKENELDTEIKNKMATILAKRLKIEVK